MRRTSYLLAALFWLGSAALLAFYGQEIRWGYLGLKLYSEGQFPRSDEMRYQRAGTSALQLRRFDEAEDYFKKSLAINPNGRPVFLMGELYRNRGEYEKALERYLRYLEIDDLHTMSYLGAAESLERLGRNEERKELLELGLKKLRAAAYVYRNVPNRTVSDTFNGKARGVEGRMRWGVKKLSEALAPPRPKVDAPEPRPEDE